MDLQLAAPIPRPVPSPSPPKWRKIVSIFKDIGDLRAPHLQTRKLKLQAMVMHLARSRVPVGVSAIDNQITATNGEVNAGARSKPDDEEDDQSSADIAADELDCSAPQAMAMAAALPPPSACLLLMRNKSSRNRVFDEDHGSTDCSKEMEDENDHHYTAAIDRTAAAPASFKAIAMPSSNASACPSSAEQDAKWIKRPSLRFWRSKSRQPWLSQEVSNKFTL